MFRSPGAWEVAQTFPESSDIYLDGGTWENPDSIVQPSSGATLIAARLGSGQILGIGHGGYFAPPAPTPDP